MKFVRFAMTAFFLLTVTIFPLRASFALKEAPESGDVKSLVTKIVDAYGGREAIEGITSLFASGSIEAVAREDHGRYDLSMKRPGRLRVDTNYERSSETRILNGGRGYRTSENLSLEQVRGHRLAAMVFQYRHLDLPYGLLTGVYSIHPRGKKDIDGRPAYVLHLTDKEGPAMDVYVDAETFLIIRVTGYFDVAEGRTTGLSVGFSDFRRVGNTVFPFKVTNYAGGRMIAETAMKIYTINPPLPDSLFEP